MKKLLLKVKNNSEIADRIFRMDLEGQFDLQEFSPGKFLHVKCGNSLTPILRRPMSTLDVSDDGSTLSLLYRVDGAGTKVMSETKVGEDIDVLAPLGGSFPYEHLEAGKTVLLVGGGIGVPPLYYLARKLVERGINVKAVLGFSSKKDSFLEKEFKALGDTFITTIDGTHGHKGMVTDITYSEELGEWDVMYCCGPTVMMKALQDQIPEETEAYMSLEERMGCGIGACLACVCKPAPGHEAKYPKNYTRVCTEGPVYPLHSMTLT